MDDKSPALQMWEIGINAACERYGRCSGFINLRRSKQKLRGVVCSLIGTIIETHARFDPRDFDSIRYYLSSLEPWYRLAVVGANIGACRSIENSLKREPFIFPVRRICVGKRFEWKDENVTCTSFNDEGGYLVACSYDDSEGHGVKHRYRITLDDIRDVIRGLRGSGRRLTETFPGHRLTLTKTF